jgi:two-component system cell cycle sensor histidine kinase/response regulator CckA
MSRMERSVMPAAEPFCAGTKIPETKPTILLVEDEGFVREVTGEVLQAAGYEVLKARNATEAVRAFHRHRGHIQLLITDVVLPDRNGPNLAQELRSMGGLLPTILISGYSERAIPQHLLRMPSLFYLPKPFSAQALMRKVRQVLEEAMAPV